jgi:hypothetical protein
MSQPPEGDVDCPHCHATFDTMDVRVIVGRPDGNAVAIKHAKDCVDYPGDADEEQDT